MRNVEEFSLGKGSPGDQYLVLPGTEPDTVNQIKLILIKKLLVLETPWNYLYFSREQAGVLIACWFIHWFEGDFTFFPENLLLANFLKLVWKWITFLLFSIYLQILSSRYFCDILNMNRKILMMQNVEIINRKQWLLCNDYSL